ncbi:RING finger protein 208 [Callorhinchus milii]|uniref:RING finger protein 208-like protein n=1 Tax=Callorhinchus milii TaxID=7868 RepID=V9KEQ2_CALMI|nr:RING finger protein 208 [Callorhinchus milii]|eukprot:gi/632964482/ref/XP_007898418.1/ PREDICTED: RING finger protein 208 [Callorhinchus milii]
MACLKQQQAAIKMEAVKIMPSEKFAERHGPQPRYGPPCREPPLVGKCVWPLESEIIVNQACTDMPIMENGRSGAGLSRTPPRREKFCQGHRKASSEICYHRKTPSDEVIVNQYVLHQSANSEPLECPTCCHTYNFTNKRPRILSCLHSVCEECLQILYESCPKYKFISCPTCKRETVLFTDYGLAALAVNTSILNRLPAEALSANPVQWSGDADRSCYQTFQQYCGAACSCQLRNPLSSCVIM